MGRSLRYLFACLLLLASVQAQADIRPYGQAHLGAGGVRHSDLDFYPSFGSLSAGVFLFNNIGIEAFTDTPFSEGKRDVFELDVSKASGFAARFQSTASRGLQAYVLLGYVEYTLEQEERRDGANRKVVQDFEGIRVSVGIQQRLKVINGLIFGVEYRNYYADSGITVDGLSAGLRYELP